MIKRLKKILLGRKKKYYKKFHSRPSWEDFNELETKYYSLNNKLYKLASSLDRELIHEAYMPSKDAKKCHEKNNTCIY